MLREMIGYAAGKLMELEVGALTGAGYGEKDPERLAQRNGYRERDWHTRAGTMELKIPRPRTGSYETPGWKRAQAAAALEQTLGTTRGPVIEGQAKLLARSTPGDASFEIGQRVFHDKFGYGRVMGLEGNKLSIAFEKSGEKKVLDSFVQAA